MDKKMRRIFPPILFYYLFFPSPIIYERIPQSSKPTVAFVLRFCVDTYLSYNIARLKQNKVWPRNRDLILKVRKKGAFGVTGEVRQKRADGRMKNDRESEWSKNKTLVAAAWLDRFDWQREVYDSTLFNSMNDYRYAKAKMNKSDLSF